MTKKELKEKQSLYLSMVDEDTKKSAQTVSTNKSTQRNIMLVYGFMLYLSTKNTDISSLKNTGRQSTIYTISTNNQHKEFMLNFKTIETWTGLSSYSAQTAVQHLINLGLIEKSAQTISTNNQHYNNNYNNNYNCSCIDCLSDLEYKRLYNEIKTDLKMELIELISETINNATNNLKVELEKYIDEKLDNIKSELIENRQVAIDATASNNNPHWVKFKEKRDRVWESINKFIESIPTLSPTQIEDCYAKYVKALANGCYDRQDYLDNALTTLNTRVAKAKEQKVKSVAPPDWMIKELPSPKDADINTVLCEYCNRANELLNKDSSSPEFKDKVNGYVQWHINNLNNKYLPILQEYRKANGKVDDITELSKAIKIIWNKNCSNYQVA